MEKCTTKGKTRNLISKALENKKDGVVVDNVKDNYNNSNKTKSTDTFTVFNSNQIKLADGSNTTFDSDSPSVRKQQEAPQSRKQIDMKRLNKMADTFYMKKDGYIPYKTTPLGELQRAARRFGLRVETRYITEGRQRGTPTGYYLSFGKNPEGFPIMFNPRTKQEKVIKNSTSVS
jgi:hypothetical protein